MLSVSGSHSCNHVLKRRSVSSGVMVDRRQRCAARRHCFRTASLHASDVTAQYITCPACALAVCDAACLLQHEAHSCTVSNQVLRSIARVSAPHSFQLLHRYWSQSCFLRSLAHRALSAVLGSNVRFQTPYTSNILLVRRSASQKPAPAKAPAKSKDTMTRTQRTRTRSVKLADTTA